MMVRELMRHPVRTVTPSDRLADAAALMADRDVGILAVVEDERLVGLVTDRDIVVRGMANRLGRRARVGEVMTAKVLSCGPDDEIDTALELMATQQVRRLPVCGPDGELVGMISIGDAAQTEEYQEAAARTLSNVSRPHGRHSQHRSAA
jgi:CBS domain-containing protein